MIVCDGNSNNINSIDGKKITKMAMKKKVILTDFIMLVILLLILLIVKIKKVPLNRIQI